LRSRSRRFSTCLAAVPSHRRRPSPIGRRALDPPSSPSPGPPPTAAPEEEASERWRRLAQPSPASGRGWHGAAGSELRSGPVRNRLPANCAESACTRFQPVRRSAARNRPRQPLVRPAAAYFPRAPRRPPTRPSEVRTQTCVGDSTQVGILRPRRSGMGHARAGGGQRSPAQRLARPLAEIDVPRRDPPRSFLGRRYAPSSAFRTRHPGPRYTALSMPSPQDGPACRRAVAPAARPDLEVRNRHAAFVFAEWIRRAGPVSEVQWSRRREEGRTRPFRTPRRHPVDSGEAGDADRRGGPRRPGLFGLDERLPRVPHKEGPSYRRRVAPRRSAPCSRSSCPPLRPTTRDRRLRLPDRRPPVPENPVSDGGIVQQKSSRE